MVKNMKCHMKNRTRISKKKGSRKSPGLKGHSWTKVFDKDGNHIGRECSTCNIKILNALGESQ